MKLELTVLGMVSTQTRGFQVMPPSDSGNPFTKGFVS